MKIYEALTTQARANPDKVAVIYGEQKYTYQQVAEAVQRRTEECRSADAYIFHELWCQEPFHIVLSILVADLLSKAVCPTQLPSAAPPEGTLLVLSTSGTTSEPKLICVSGDAKLARIQQFISLYGVQSTDTILVGTPLTQSLAIRLVLVALCTGATARIVPRYTPAIWLHHAAQSTFIVGVPTQLRHMADHKWLHSGLSRKDRIRFVLSASAPRLRSDMPLLCMLRDCGIEYWDSYGTSEVAMLTTGPCTEEYGKVGKLVPHASVAVSRESTEICVLSAPTLFSGYLEQATLEVFHTGDTGSFGRDRVLTLTGRLSDKIIVGGTTIYPEPIERAVIESGLVTDCYAVSVDDKELGEVVGLVCALQHAYYPSVDFLRELQLAVSKVLRHDPAVIPRALRVVPKLPRTESGKPQRRKAAELFKEAT